MGYADPARPRLGNRYLGALGRRLVPEDRRALVCVRCRNRRVLPALPGRSRDPRTHRRRPLHRCRNRPEPRRGADSGGGARQPRRPARRGERPAVGPLPVAVSDVALSPSGLQRGVLPRARRGSLRVRRAGSARMGLCACRLRDPRATVWNLPRRRACRLRLALAAAQVGASLARRDPRRLRGVPADAVARDRRPVGVRPYRVDLGKAPVERRALRGGSGRASAPAGTASSPSRADPAGASPVSTPGRWRRSRSRRRPSCSSSSG